MDELSTVGEIHLSELRDAIDVVSIFLQRRGRFLESRCEWVELETIVAREREPEDVP